jgi:hypothetical protein
MPIHWSPYSRLRPVEECNFEIVERLQMEVYVWYA